MIYLDHNATTPVRPEVVSRIAEVLALPGNPSSTHAAGRQARKVLDDARDQVAAACGASPREIVFTSGGTEANGMALSGISAEHLIVSATEHDSILTHAGESGLPYDVVPVDSGGSIQLDVLESCLRAAKGRMLVSVMLANNETGVLQPISEIASLAKEHEAIIHCDAVQAFGKIPVDFEALGVDYMSLSSHKIGGPKGVGCLVVREGLDVKPFVHGGGQETGRRSGTENLPGIGGFGMAASMVPDLLAQMEELQQWRDSLESDMRSASNDVVVMGDADNRLSNTLNISMPGVDNDVQLMALDLAGYCVSAGSACSSGKVSVSHVLQAMNVPPDIARTTLRISLGWNTQQQDVEAFAEAWKDIYSRKAAKAAP
jgi:cysteine desulfurase